MGGAQNSTYSHSLILFKRKNYSKNSFDPSLFLFLLLLFFLSLFSFFNLHQIFKETWKKKKNNLFFKKKRNANQEDGTSFPPRKSYLKKKQYQQSFFKKNIFLNSL